jgi:hypothetical protein
MLKASIPPENLMQFTESFNDRHYIKEAGRVMNKNNVESSIMYEMMAAMMQYQFFDWNEAKDPVGAQVCKQYMDAMNAYNTYIYEEGKRQYMERERLENIERSRIRMEKSKEQREELRKKKAENKEKRGGLTVKEFKEKRKAERELKKEQKKQNV